MPRPGAGLDSELLTPFAILAVCRSDEHISVGLTISIPDRAPETIAATDDVPVRADWLQHELQQGPAISPERSPMTVCKDLGAAERWPDFGRMCVAVLELRSMLTVEIPTRGIRASLNFYSTGSSAFDDFDVDAALLLARLAVPAARNAVEAIHHAHLDLPHTDASRVAIALATVMAQQRVGPTDGFAVLREASRHSSRPLFDTAVDVVRNGGLPQEAIAGTGRLQPDRTPTLSNDATGPVRHVGGPDMWRNPPATPGPAPTITRQRRTPRFPLDPAAWAARKPEVHEHPRAVRPSPTGA